VFYANEAIMITLWSHTPVISCSNANSYAIGNGTSSTFTTCLKSGDEVLNQLSMNKVRFLVYSYLTFEIELINFFFFEEQFQFWYDHDDCYVGFLAHYSWNFTDS
jgi:hypothetical protein